jgi:pilus assembly protein CpaE
METHQTIAVIDLDGDSSLATADMLKEIPGADVQTETQDLYRGISMIRRTNPAVVILSLAPSEEAAMECAQKINQYFPECALIVAARKMSSSLVLNAMRVGAREFITQPFNKDELVGAVKKILQAKKNASPDSLLSSKMVTVFGVKGGVGTTTVAVNLASLLAKHAKADAIVIDLNFQFGDAALLLNVKTRCSVLDLAGHIDRLDVSQLATLLPKTPGGVSLLSGPAKIEEAENITCGHLEQIMMAVRSAFPYIVVDAAHVLNDFTVKAMDESDHILAVATPDVPSIYNTTRCLDIFKKMGYDREKVLVALNRCNGADELDPSTVEELLKYPVSWRFPKHDADAMAAAVNKGVPITQLLPNSKLSQNLMKMAQHLGFLQRIIQ